MPENYCCLHQFKHNLTERLYVKILHGMTPLISLFMFSTTMVLRSMK